jgi:hypothetical protein
MRTPFPLETSLSERGEPTRISTFPSFSLSFSWEVVSFLFRGTRGRRSGALHDDRDDARAARDALALEAEVLEEPRLPELREGPAERSASNGSPTFTPR